MIAFFKFHHSGFDDNLWGLYFSNRIIRFKSIKHHEFSSELFAGVASIYYCRGRSPTLTGYYCSFPSILHQALKTNKNLRG